MVVIFEVIDKTGRKIHLSKERWQHILKLHPYLADSLEEIKATLTNPLLILPSKDDRDVVHYYKHYQSKNRYLLVSVCRSITFDTSKSYYL